MPANLIVVEDDQPLLQFLAGWLKDEGFLVEPAATGASALQLISRIRPDLVILDLGLPDIHGASVLKQIKAGFPSLPVIILTAKNKVDDIAAHLNLGADDYLAKPFAAAELLARIRARLRPQQTAIAIRVADLYLNTESGEVRRAKRQLRLTKTEYELLLYLTKHAGKIVHREAILNHVWGLNKNIESRVVDVYIGYLRKKVDRGFNHKLIVNRRGFGYGINPPAAARQYRPD